MTQRFVGKVAVVTGGTSGIGRGCCLRLAREGGTVVVAGRNAAAGREVADMCGEAGRFIFLDVTSRDSWQALKTAVLATYGAPDVLVQSAGVSLRCRFDELSLEEWRRVVDVNLTGTFLGCCELIPEMRGLPSAAIVNIGSTSAFRATATMAPYDASKAGLAWMTKSIASYCISMNYRIRCNVVHPGTVRTPLLERSMAIDPASVQGWLRDQPLEHFGQTEDIAAAVAFLASDDASTITGQNLPVDGGWLA